MKRTKHTKTVKDVKSPVLRHTPYRQRDLWGILLLGIYLLLLVWVVICKADFRLPTMRPERVLNLIPFYYAQADAMGNPLIEAGLNVLIFLPLGAYLSLLGVRWYRVILYGFLLSLGFEATQLALAIGVADVTDLITNTTGTAIGLGIYILLRWLCKNRKQPDTVLRIVATVCTGVVLVLIPFLLFL